MMCPNKYIQISLNYINKTKFNFHTNIQRKIPRRHLKISHRHYFQIPNYLMFSKFFSYIPNVAFVTSSATPVETNRPYSFSYPESQISSPRRCRNKLQGDGSDIFTSTYLTNVNSVWLHVLRVIFTYGAEIPPKGNVRGWIFVLFF